MIKIGDELPPLLAIERDSYIQEHDIHDDADNIANFCLELAFHFNEPNLDVFLDMPASRIPLYQKKLAEIKERIEATGGR